MPQRLEAMTIRPELRHAIGAVTEPQPQQKNLSPVVKHVVAAKCALLLQSIVNLEAEDTMVAARARERRSWEVNIDPASIIAPIFRGVSDLVRSPTLRKMMKELRGTVSEVRVLRTETRTIVQAQAEMQNALRTSLDTGRP